ncbi:MAG: ribosome small subunit-dependent GTPase A [Candidatus Moranbacteria bacterium]|nr:ribosome small subunit-dependent GTPase A [Candidatus Moranbacteria bacterium]
MKEKISKIEDFGYCDFFENERVKLGLNLFEVARVTSELRGAYKVKNSNGEFLAKVPGKHIFKASSRQDYPAVGDWVAISELNKEQALIQAVLPRKTSLKRKYGDRNEAQLIATNIDVAFVIESVDRDFNLNRIERYSAIASNDGIKTVVILNKVDLITEQEASLKLQQIKERLEDVDIIMTSILTEKGLAQLKAYLEKGKSYCFLGSSGVGKSSLINKLLAGDLIKTNEIGLHSSRGKHTTTAREMYFLENGAIVIDNPGTREVGMTDTSAGIASLFDEITALSEKCKFVDCTHLQEPGCSVLSALKTGELSQEKYLNFISLKKETEHFKMNQLEKREKERNFGKFIKKAKKDLKNHSHKDYD